MSKKRKPRFYHWWVYKLFRVMWNPILRSNAAYRQCFIDSFTTYGYPKNITKSVNQLVAETDPKFYAECWFPYKETEKAPTHLQDFEEPK